MYEYELFDVDGGYGFRIKVGDSIVQEQPYKPRMSGFEPMTEAEAIAEATETIRRMTNGYQEYA